MAWHPNHALVDVLRTGGPMKTAIVSNGAIANRPGWKHYIDRLQGSTVRYDLTRYESPVAEIAELETACRQLSDQEILRRSQALHARALSAEPRIALRASLYALAREASSRVLGQRPFDEQLVAALALDDGHVIEMLTGEGKTLAAVMPAALNAFTDRGVHVLTFNDYLARRDAEWMDPVYQMLGLSAGYVHQGMTPSTRRAAYNADITYVTAKEAGFDHLRDLLAMDEADLVHRPFNFALVDEADSLMIDEARVPLVIAGSFERDASLAPRLAELVASLSPGIHFDTDESGRDVELTEAGIEHVERALGCGGLHRAENILLLTELNCGLHARVLLRRDVDYIVRNGRIEIVDEFTGRVVADRHWPDGLQSALEAKEGLERRPDGRILGSMTLQRFLRGYPRLGGMTGTARGSAAELQQLYGLEVVVIPTHRPMVRVDREDLVFTHRDAKAHAIVDEIRRAHAVGRPVLVGTSTVTESEHLAQRLRIAGVPCEVLNAKNDAEEASIVAGAGALGAVTISTNMAGRGTDIRLGGEREGDRDRVAALGGLYIIGTNRHESERVDLQLRGRAGRQGDPGESRFVVSLEDELLVRHGLRGLIPARFLPERSDAPIDSPIVRREVARAQRIIEGQNLEIRRTLAGYASVVEEQHRRLIERRRAMLLGEDAPDVWARVPARRAVLVAAAGERAVLDAERAVTLACIDRAWRDHLALCADLREGIHLVRLGGQDPLTRFTSEAIRAFSQIDEAIDEAVLAAVATVRVAGGELDLTATGLKGPSSTWTYLVNDDPFRNRIGALLTGPGGVTVAIYSAAIMGPLLILWGLVETLLRRGPPRRADPFGK
jgi:preprotein translocase subunit SecA